MLRDITIGQYYQAKSKIHSLDPRVKLFGTIAFMAALFIADNVLGYVIAAIFLMTAIKMSNVPIRYILKGIKTIIILILFSVTFSVLFTDGLVILDLGFINITLEGIIKGIKLTARLIMLIMGTSLLTYTTTPTDIADGMEKAFAPLNKLRFPVHEIAMMISIAFRFIPILIEETDKIMKAQMARGADFESGRLFQRAKAMVPLIVPLVISSIKRALDLATAMEARCYRGGAGRTKMKPLKYKRRDAIAYLSLITLVLVAIGSNFMWHIIWM